MGKVKAVADNAAVGALPLEQIMNAPVMQSVAIKNGSSDVLVSICGEKQRAEAIELEYDDSSDAMEKQSASGKKRIRIPLMAGVVVPVVCVAGGLAASSGTLLQVGPPGCGPFKNMKPGEAINYGPLSIMVQGNSLVFQLAPPNA